MEKKIEEIFKKIRNIFEKFNSLSILYKIIWISVILITFFYLVVIPYIFFIVAKFSIQNFYIQLIDPLGFNFQKPMGVFFFLAILLLIIPSILLMVKGKINIYFWASIFISLFLITFGLSFIGETYRSDLPSSIYWKPYPGTNYLNEENCSYSRLDCKSVKDKKNFVEGDEVYCVFNLDENCSFWISDFRIDKNYLNQIDSRPLEETEIDLSKNQVVFRFEVEKTIEDIWTFLYISNGTISDSPFWTIVELNEIYSDEDYLSLKQTKSLAIITLVSISLFSTFVAMNNLRQLIERKK